ncbi:NifB/NifX family molybdenum-iron cluster-binding protein [Treponema sp.]|uniref:NifB/NifX family molybdenum-iron cluster-binding protein n=1 Tax=Treponema sp. TaxID=166 RepID=UPI00298D783D|nr:NifB/NifX family molybdenum-iron cluster-binding protein [Treponema sp.]MCR5614157.1 hypothetical protein [Treponema sp.]
MSYKIAVASSDGVNIDVHFGAAKFFSIYEVQDDASFSFLEKREVPEDAEVKAGGLGNGVQSGNGAGCGNAEGCGNGSRTGCGQNNGGCGNGGASAKVELISDVRAVVAEKIGFNVTKQLEKKAIANFDVDCSVKEALKKITKYFYSVDNHIRFGR